jgi:hypothetical protein
MPETSNDILYPTALVIPLVTTAVRDTMVADVGTLIYNSTTNKLNICKTKAAAAGSWEAVTSA